MHIIGRKTGKNFMSHHLMNDNMLKWVWLTTLKGMTPEKTYSLLDKLGSIEEIYQADYDDFSDIDLINQSDIKELCNKNTSVAQQVISRTEECGGYIVTYDSKQYPQSLKNIFPPPYVLYVKGSLELTEDMFCIGIVGTRELNDYGDTVTRKMSFELARAGFCVVSGLARGVDAVAASSAIRAGGKTIAVLGCGIDRDYPKKNRELRKLIEEYGVVVSEYPPGTKPLSSNFPQRNRIIAGLSECVLVTQAPKKSGALITADYADSYSKTVYCVPAGIFDLDSEGNNNLIKNGAVCVTHSNEIIEIYKSEIEKFKPKELRREIGVPDTVKKGVSRFIEKIKVSINDEKYKNLNETEKVLMELILENEKISVDELIRKTELPPAKIGATLAMMEMKGTVKKLPGNFYIA